MKLNPELLSSIMKSLAEMPCWKLHLNQFETASCTANKAAFLLQSDKLPGHIIRQPPPGTSPSLPSTLGGFPFGR